VLFFKFRRSRSFVPFLKTDIDSRNVDSLEFARFRFPLTLGALTMQRDMKIGMALGVALVGIVGALVFRREPEVKDKEAPPPLQNAQELDREIAGRAKAPYIKGLEEFDNAAAPVPPAPGPLAKSKDSAKSKDEQAKQSEGAARKPGAAPDPIQSPKTETLANDQVPAHNRDWEPVGPSAAPGKKAGENPRSSPAGNSVGTGRTHVIQPGETLSALATRYLGSSSRYREIYEANRNVLRSPDDVREGLSIVIPDSPAGKPLRPQHVAEGSGSGQSAAGHSGTKAQKASTRTMKPERDEPASAVELTGDRPPREKLRFVPVPRGPFSAGRVAAPAKSETRKAAPAAEDSMDENQ
jgi:hypothetical protein